MKLEDWIAKQTKADPTVTIPTIEPGPVATEAPATEQPAPAVVQPKPKDDYATTTATTPAEGAEERSRKDAEEEDTASAMAALGYGAARGATLGAVDRLVGLGTAIGERAGEAAGAARTVSDPYNQARSEYLAGERKAAEAHPVLDITGNIIGGAIPAAITGGAGLASRTIDAGKWIQRGARAVDAAALGGTAGALNTVPDEAGSILSGAAKGAAGGLAAEATLGTLARGAIRNAPAREENAFLRDVMESEAGRATATTAKKVARDIDDIRDVLKNDPEARAAIRGPSKQAIPVIQKRVNEITQPQPARYEAVDSLLGKDKLTVTGLLQKLVDKEKEIPAKNLPLVKLAMLKLRDSIRNDFAPRWSGDATWKGKRVEISSQQLREWVSSTQATAEAAVGTINGTNAAKVPEAVSRLANEILEERLDQAAAKGGKEIVAQIRESDRQASAYLGVMRALEDRKWRELSQAIGFTKRVGQAQQNQANAAAAGLAAGGQIVPALAVAGGGPIKRAASEVARTINDRALAPLQRAADAGMPLAEMSRMAAELGIPQGIARVIYERKRQQVPVVMPSDYRTTTGTQ